MLWNVESRPACPLVPLQQIMAPSAGRDTTSTGTYLANCLIFLTGQVVLWCMSVVPYPDGAMLSFQFESRRRRSHRLLGQYGSVEGMLAYLETHGHMRARCPNFQCVHGHEASRSHTEMLDLVRWVEPVSYTNSCIYLITI